MYAKFKRNLYNIDLQNGAPHEGSHQALQNGQMQAGPLQPDQEPRLHHTPGRPLPRIPQAHEQGQDITKATGELIITREGPNRTVALGAVPAQHQQQQPDDAEQRQRRQPAARPATATNIRIAVQPPIDPRCLFN